MNKDKGSIVRTGFTLVELLAVIVIVAIILVIAVPKVMSVIEDAKKATLESTAKMIASQAEKQKVQNTVLGKTDEITCDSVAKINNNDYASCEIIFENNTAKVTIEGSGKFEGLYVCNGTKTEAKAAVEECVVNNDQDTAILPEIGITAEDCTWEEIKAIGEAGKADEYFNLGDTKTITLTTGEQVVMEIVAFDADTKSDGSTAAITWLSKDLLSTQRAMNSTNTNTGGWEASELRSWLHLEVYNTLPSEVKNAIVPVKKTYYDYYATEPTKSCVDNIWIPSYREIFGDTSYETSGATYTSFFTDKTSRKKYDSSGIARGWWLRSARNYWGSNEFKCVSGYGSDGWNNSDDACRMALGFCTG